MKLKCFENSCTECGKKIGILGGYTHPVLGKGKCVCGDCFQKIEESEENYSNFIKDSMHCENGMGAICFVLISTVPKYEKNVLNKLSEMKEIIEVHPLLGWYDIIAKIKAKDSVNLGSFITRQIRTIEGIEGTRTLTGSFSLVGI